MTTDGGWGEYQRLVLAELERFNTADAARQREIADLRLMLRDVDGSIKDIKRRLDRLDDDQTEYSLVARVKKLEVTDLGELTIKKYRGWLIAMGIGLLSSIVLPLVALWLTQRGSSDGG